jgi:hypothetical protein
MAERLGVDEAAIAGRIATLLATLGATDRAQATTLAFRGLGASVMSVNARAGAVGSGGG